MTTFTLPQLAAQPAPIPLDAGLPYIGHLIEASRDILGFFTRMARQYPELVELKIMGGTFYLINHPELIEQVLVKNSHAFIKDKTLKNSAHAVFGDGLLANDGDFWLRQRRMAQPAFHRQRIMGYATDMARLTQRMLDQWQPGQVRDLHQDMMALTLQIVAKSLFDAEDNQEVHDISHALDAIMERFAGNGIDGMVESLISRIYTLPVQKNYVRAVADLNRVVEGVIAARKAEGDEHPRDHGDLLSMLLEARDDDGAPMSDIQLRDECKTMFLAGHETTALTLSWTWLELMQHPTALAKLREEGRRVLNGRTPTFNDLPALVYTNQVMMESMRMHPPAWVIQREIVEDVQIGDYVLKQGKDVLMSQYAVHHNPNWFPSPEHFKPERWEGDAAKRLPKFAYFPFGGGPRLCIGQQFALMEATLILTMMAQRFDFDLMPHQRIVPQPSITMRPKYGLKVRVKAL